MSYPGTKRIGEPSANRIRCRFLFLSITDLRLRPDFRPCIECDVNEPRTRLCAYVYVCMHVYMRVGGESIARSTDWHALVDRGDQVNIVHLFEGRSCSDLRNGKSQT